MRRFTNTILLFWLMFLSVGAGEGKEVAEAGDDGEDMFGGDDDADDADDAGGGKSDDDDSDSDNDDDSDDGDDDEEDEDDDDDDDDDDEDAESTDDDTDSEGAGGEERVDPAISLTLQRNWEGRMEVASKQTRPDPLAVIRNSNLEIPEATRAKVTKLFEEEKDIDAIATVLQELAPALFSAYDEARVAPVMDAAEITSRAQRLERGVTDFDKSYPGARTDDINQAMADKYDEFKQKYGYKAADAVPVDDYFVMAGGVLPKKKAESKKKPKRKGKSRKARAEEEKRRSLSTTREPSRVARPKNPKGGKGRRRKSTEDVDETFDAVQATRFDPFHM